MVGNAARRRILALAAIGLLASAAGLTAHQTGLFGWLEHDTVDARFSLRPHRHPPQGVVVVGIDNDTLGELPRFPFSRRLDARVLENLHGAGARLVVYDISFDRPTTPGADLALFEAARRAAPVVFSTSLISPTGATQVLGGNANLSSIADQAAAADLLPDSDGVLRHTLGEVHGLPTVAAAVARRVGGHVSDGGLPNGGWIDFPGPPGTVRNLSFAAVLHNRFDRAAVRGRVVVIGATAPVLQDLHSTAAGSPMSGPEVQADAISTVLEGFPLRSPSGVITVLLIAALGLAVPLAGMRLGTLGACLVGVGILLAWSLATRLAFDSGAVLDYSDPLAALAIGAGGTVLLGTWLDGRERRRLRNLFAADAGGVVERVLHPHGSSALAPTAIIAGYRIEEVVGRGGMGVIYRATQLELDRTVAIKLIATERTADPVFRERFKLESRVAASIDHANVVPVYEAGEDDGLLFIAMRLVEGVDLAQLLGRLGPLEPARALRLVEQLAGALDAAHARGLVHRDVKPANVLLTADEPEHVYLTDFGVAKSVGAGSGITRTDQWVGTLDYLAPEQIRGEAADAAVDIYALTGLLHHCLTGQVPYPRDNEPARLWAQINAPPPSPGRIVADLPQALDAVIGRGLAKNPADRYASAGELARAAALALGLTSRLSAPGSSPRARTDGEAQPGALTAVSEDG
jgi:CHASE2 domain-containing sensor protein/tRNA A-37 threonylcarbamoyl transferase component Bud32